MMLIGNKSKLVYKVDLCLEMEDGTVQNLEVNEGDIIHIKFRHNGFLLTKQGKVMKINPSRIIESEFYGTQKLSAILDMDCSEEYRQELYKVDISDILQILPVYVTMGEPSEDNSGLQFTPGEPRPDENYIPPAFENIPDIEVTPDEDEEENPEANKPELAGGVWEDFGDFLKGVGK